MADALAEELQRSVVINDPEIRLICASRHFGDEDEVRVHAVLQRMTEKAAIGHILSHDVAQWSGPGVVPGRADIGMAARLCRSTPSSRQPGHGSVALSGLRRRGRRKGGAGGRAGVKRTVR